MQKILITGALGMIGSALVRYLNDLGKKELILVDDFGDGDKWKNLLHKQFQEFVAKEDLFSFLEEKKPNFDAIIHLGACSDTLETNVDYLIENNYQYTIRLAKWALDRNVRFVYASSAATYGDGSLGFEDNEENLEKLTPLNPYGFSKHLVDLWMKKEKVLDRVVGLKYFNVFGPNEYHKAHMASMVLKMMKTLSSEDAPIRLYRSYKSEYPDGGQMRDFIYVKDAVQKTCAFLDPKYLHVSGVFNIGLAKPTTWNFLAESFFAALGKKTKIEYIEMPSDLKKQYQYFTCASMKKFEKAFSSDLKYTQNTSVDLAVKDYVQNYLLQGSRW